MAAGGDKRSVHAERLNWYHFGKALENGIPSRGAQRSDRPIPADGDLRWLFVPLAHRDMSQ